MLVNNSFLKSRIHTRCRSIKKLTGNDGFIYSALIPSEATHHIIIDPSQFRCLTIYKTALPKTLLKLFHLPNFARLGVTPRSK